MDKEYSEPVVKDRVKLRKWYEHAIRIEKDVGLDDKMWEVFSTAPNVDFETRQNMSREDFGYQTENEKLASNLRAVRAEKQRKLAEAEIISQRLAREEQAKLVARERAKMNIIEEAQLDEQITEKVAENNLNGE